ncbi:methyl-accepting chemotaxis protein [Weizmannia acidilactici]|uniref:methyl-accepting chemotaxis protein n=1 Tax=Weizmannia acidilactici TaxID=2607726 RepID=UPI00127F218C|nr:methyl-accepting chemotaxis protein [Weizmannia acidilactici]GER66543.1 hypothetical protein BpJC4_10140 [Weizmannia acidilactici]GER74563.1 hypothetical protein BpPP18_26300 [Weizmannia acidilactici]
MMCEGDLEEVYRMHGVNWRYNFLYRQLTIGFIILNEVYYITLFGLLPRLAGVIGLILFNTVYSLLAGRFLNWKLFQPLENHLHMINRFIRMNAKGEGDLTKRLQADQFPNDETKSLAIWINNMIDSLEGIMVRVKRAAADVQESQRQLNESTRSTEASAERVSSKMAVMLKGTRQQLSDLDVAKDASRQMSETLRKLEKAASKQLAVAQDEVSRIGNKMDHIQSTVKETNGTIYSFIGTTEKIKQLLQVIDEISTKTNLLSLNASIEAA